MGGKFHVAGKVVVITGGTGVLGSAIASGLASAGAKVVVMGRNPARRDRVVEQIQRAGGVVLGISCDVLDRGGLLRARDEVLQRYGTVDVLINGAGGNRPTASTGPEQPLFGLEPEEVEQVFRLNFTGTFLPSQVFGEVFAEKGDGVILNISSMASFRPLPNVVGYAAAKAAVNNFTQWLAVHMNLNYSPHIRVNAIAPGFFLTEQNRYLMMREDGNLTERAETILAHTPMGRFGEPEDLLGTVQWLISDASKFVTGVVVPVDGGFSAFSGV